MPPWAPPRMMLPSWRIASAPMRPFMAAIIGVLRVTSLIGDGPSDVQLPPKVVGTGGAAFRAPLRACAADLAAAPLRNWPASMPLSGVSPAVRRLSNAKSLASSSCSLSSSKRGGFAPELSKTSSVFKLSSSRTAASPTAEATSTPTMTATRSTDRRFYRRRSNFCISSPYLCGRPPLRRSGAFGTQ